MGRYVRRGSKGIALIDDSGDRLRLRYVFDVSDTGAREHSRYPYLWKLEPEHEDKVSAMLEQQFGVSGREGLVQQLVDVAGTLAEDYLEEPGRGIRYIGERSFRKAYADLHI